MNKNIILGVVIVIILGSIFYLESQKTDVGDVVREELAQENVSSLDAGARSRIAQKQEQFSSAIELVSPDGYIGTEPFTLSEHIGEKVILIDFWTYSCINCQRTIPYLQSWWKSYEDDGLLIVGVHTPEFAFEKDRKNVVRAMEQFGVIWPVVQDNNKQSFRAYNNRYWPRKYLVDIDGFIVYDHIGEGAYEETEAKIVELLEERKEVLGLDIEIERGTVDEVESQTDFSELRTPEMYFGYKRSAQFIGGVETIIPNTVSEYELPADRESHKFYLEGSWLTEEERVVAKSDARILLDYRARIVNVVAASEQPVEINVYIDGEFVDAITVQEPGLYQVYDSGDYEEHELELRVKNGFEAYTFTFG